MNGAQLWSTALSFGLAFLLNACSPGSVLSQDGNSRIQLVSHEFPATEWHFFSGKKDAVISETWSIQQDSETGQPVLICKGEPYGYIRTRRRYKNFELRMQWKFATDANGNSGILLYTSGDDRIWPTSIQVQLHQPVAGSVFPTGGAKTTEELRQVPMLAKPVNQWNDCLILSTDGRVSVTINGVKVGDVNGCDPQEGAIALQSQGAEVHFRAISIRELPEEDPDRQAAQPTADSGNIFMSPQLMPPQFMCPQEASQVWMIQEAKRKTPLKNRSKKSQEARGERG